MIIAGLIAEYNPFHNGHLYQIEKIKKELNPDILIIIVSGYFTMRGDISTLSKEKKAEYALNYGADIILELPLAFSLNNASIFAFKAIEILNNFKITHLCFGSEINDIKVLEQNLKYQNTLEYQNKLKEKLKTGNSFAYSSSTNYENIESNDLLNIEYLKAIKKINKNIIPYPIKRISSTYNETTPNSLSIASANYIRSTNNFSKYLPDEINDYFSINPFLKNEDFFEFLKYQILTKSADELNNIHLMKEGFENKILKDILISNSYLELLSNLSTKRYSNSYIKRVLISILLNIKKDDLDLDEKNYNKILKFSPNGQKYLNKIKKEINFSSSNKNLNNKINKIELKTKYIYNNLLNKQINNKIIK